MSTVVLDGLNREPVLCRSGRGVDQSRGTRERRVGPHIAAHEVLWLVSLVAGFWERRGSDDGGSVLVLQSPIGEPEVGLVVLSPHMLMVTGRVNQLSERGTESWYLLLPSPHSRRHRNDLPIW